MGRVPKTDMQGQSAGLGKGFFVAAAPPAAPDPLGDGENKGLCSLGTRQSESATTVSFAKFMPARSTSLAACS